MLSLLMIFLSIPFNKLPWAGSMKSCLSTANIGVSFDSVNGKPVLNSLSKSNDIPQTKKKYICLDFDKDLYLWILKSCSLYRIYLQNEELSILEKSFPLSSTWVNGSRSVNKLLSV